MSIFRSLRASETKLQLVCDHGRQAEDEGLFNIVLDNGHRLIVSWHRKNMHVELLEVAKMHDVL